MQKINLVGLNSCLSIASKKQRKMTILEQNIPEIKTK
jgi:hypothetical protein